jgi:hypothetical protein
MSQRFPNIARGSGRHPYLMIVPEDTIYADFSECRVCTWVAAGPNRMRLKYLNSSCLLHMHLRRMPA